MEVEAETWLDDKPSSYACPNMSDMEGNVFTSWLPNAGLRTYHFLIGHRAKKRNVIDEESQLVNYKDAIINKAASIVTVIASSVIPMLTICAQYP
jgi:hypothetical protein